MFFRTKNLVKNETKKNSRKLEFYNKFKLYEK